MSGLKEMLADVFIQDALKLLDDLCVPDSALSDGDVAKLHEARDLLLQLKDIQWE